MRLQSWLLSFAIVVLLGIGMPVARAQADGPVKKSDEKAASRWSLADYIAQKNKNRLSDLWLAKNSHSSLFEFELSLQSANYNRATDPNTISNRDFYEGTAGVYIGVFGLRGGYEADTESRSRWMGSANLRLFGRALQDTHLNLEYGILGLTLPPSDFSNGANESFQNQFGGVTADLYLTRHFGFEGHYRRLLPAQSNLGRTMEGEQEQIGIFLDLGFCRLFGNWSQEFLKFDGDNQASASEFRPGLGGGFSLYF